jgi:ABC-type multidrug transport system ATPase subunit
MFGPNGAGKTTLIRILSTLSRATSGEFSINNFDIKENPIDIRQSIGMVSHSPFLYDELTAYENLEFYGKMFNVRSDKLKGRVKELLREVGLQHRMFDRVGTFSRGMKQRMAIARVLLYKPKVLFLDEPYTGLDPNASDVLDSLLYDFNRKGGTILMTTHDLEHGLRSSSRVAILVNGRIEFDERSDKLNAKKFKNIYRKVIKGDYD